MHSYGGSTPFQGLPAPRAWHRLSGDGGYGAERGILISLLLLSFLVCCGDQGSRGVVLVNVVRCLYFTRKLMLSDHLSFVDICAKTSVLRLALPVRVHSFWHSFCPIFYSLFLVF